MPYARPGDDGTTILRTLRRRTKVKIGAFVEGLPCVRSSYVSVENGTKPASPELGEAIAERLTELGQAATCGQLFLPEAGRKPKPNVNEPGNPPPQPQPAPKPQRGRTGETRTPKRIQSQAAAS